MEITIRTKKTDIKQSKIKDKILILNRSKGNFPITVFLNCVFLNTNLIKKGRESQFSGRKQSKTEKRETFYNCTVHSNVVLY